MATFLDYMHGHVFVFIAVAILLAIFFSLVLFRNEYALVPSSVSPSTGASESRSLFWIMIILPSLGWIWAVFMPIGFGHRDEIALLTEPLVPTMYSGRFFPMGHMEFNFISLDLTDGNLAPLYVLPFLQLLLVLFFIDRIVSPASLFIRVYAMALAFLLALAVPFSNLIVPERNAIFFLLASLYLIKCYQDKRRAIFLALGLAAAGISLYYKEPMFAFWLGIAFGLFCYDFGALVHYARMPQGQDGAPRLLSSIQLGLFLSSMFFLLGYVFFVFYKGPPGSYYGGNGGWVGLPDRFLTYMRDVPLLSVLILTGVGAHFLIPRNSFDRALAVSLSIGGAGYVLVLIVLSLTLNGYYFAIPILAQVISSSLLFKHLVNYHWVTTHGKKVQINHNTITAVVLSICLLYGTFAVAKNVYNSVSRDIAMKKNYIAEYAFINTELAAVGDIRSVYYAPKNSQYNDYATTILMIYLHKSGVADKFDIYSSTGCSVWNESYKGGLIHCSKREFKSTDDYDVLLIENNSLDSEYLSNYHLVRFDLPFKGADGKHGSTTIAKKINGQ